VTDTSAAYYSYKKWLLAITAHHWSLTNCCKSSCWPKHKADFSI